MKFTQVIVTVRVGMIVCCFVVPVQSVARVADAQFKKHRLVAHSLIYHRYVQDRGEQEELFCLSIRCLEQREIERLSVRKSNIQISFLILQTIVSNKLDVRISTIYSMNLNPALQSERVQYKIIINSILVFPYCFIKITEY